MAPYDQDLRLIKTVGIAISLIGVVLLMLSLVSAVLVIIRVAPTTTVTYTYITVMQYILAFGMSFSMIACGSQLSHPEPLVATGLETLRLNWAALFGFMVVSWLLGFWLLPVLGGLSLLIILLLLSIRPSVIRIS